MNDSMSGCGLLFVVVAIIAIIGVVGYGWVSDLIADRNESQAAVVQAEANRLNAQVNVITANTERAAQQARDDRAQYVLHAATMAAFTRDPFLWFSLFLMIVLTVIAVAFIARYQDTWYPERQRRDDYPYRGPRE